MKLNGKTSPENASTITEVIAAMAILSICMAGLMGAMAQGFRSIQLARENQRATQILLEQTEMIRLYSWDQVNTPGVIPTQFNVPYDPRTTGGLIYTCSVAISPVPFSASYKDNLRQATFTLNWVSQKLPRTRTITTLVSKDGLQNYLY